LCAPCHAIFPFCSFRIDRRKYHPAPKVHGAVARFELTPPAERLALPSEAEFVKLVGHG
jgi:16S rRNA A1518/A1519 N6-dimethyltransferase RsmA/KsgA/DIM1 with predicted DNA glycosylase/AP lyase activity